MQTTPRAPSLNKLHKQHNIIGTKTVAEQHPPRNRRPVLHGRLSRKKCVFPNVPTSLTSGYKLPRWSTQFGLMRMELAGKGGMKSQNPPLPSCVKRQGAKTGVTTFPEETELSSHAPHGHLQHICGATGPSRTGPCLTRRKPSLRGMNLPVPISLNMLTMSRRLMTGGSEIANL